MSVNPVSSSNAHLGAEPPADGDPPAGPMVVSDPLLILAELLLNADYLRSELDRQSLEAARAAQREAMKQQVAEMHEAADAVQTGALVEGAFTAAGAAVSGTATALEPGVTTAGGRTRTEVAGEVGVALRSMASSAGELAGDAPRMHHEANAKQAEHEAERASWQADDARQHGERVANHTDRMLEQVSAIIDGEHAGNLAILANS